MILAQFIFEPLCNPQVADLDKYGSFTMTIYEDGTMDYTASIKKANSLFSNGSTRKYHLHSGFLGDLPKGKTVGVKKTADACGASFTYGHYDPFSACGGASTAKSAPPLGTGCSPDTDNYCTNKSDDVLEAGQSDDACEVGDLSGRFGALPGGTAFTVTKTGVSCPGCYDDYVGSASSSSDVNDGATYKTWGSIVFHNGSPRVLCGDLVEV